MATGTGVPPYTFAYVVHNPTAGPPLPFDVRDTMLQHLPTIATTAEWCWATERCQVVAGVQSALARGADLCVAVGGDGTVSWAADALAHSPVPLGIVPTGTGNVLARELRIPLEIHAALHLLSGPHVAHRMDAMRVGDAYYLLNVSAGLSSRLMHDTTSGDKRRLGMWAYVLTALRQLSGVQLRRFTLFVNGRRMRVRACEVAVVNASTIGLQLLRWSPDIRVDDGQLDLCILRAATAVDLVRVLIHAVLGRQRTDPALRIIPFTGGVTIVARHGLTVQADGDVIGQSPVHVTLARRAIAVIVPLPAAAGHPRW